MPARLVRQHAEQVQRMGMLGHLVQDAAVQDPASRRRPAPWCWTARASRWTTVSMPFLRVGSLLAPEGHAEKQTTDGTDNTDKGKKCCS